MTTLLRLILGLHSYISINRTTIMWPIQLIVHLSNGVVKEGKRGVNGEFNQWNCCCFDEFDLCNPLLSYEEFLQSLESSFYSFRLRQKVHVHENWIIDSYINITVPDGNATSTASKQLYGNIVKLQQILDSLEGYNSSIMKFVSFLRYTISYFL